MRKVVVSTYVTLDGVYEDPGGAEEFEHGGWNSPFFDEEAMEYARQQLWASDALLLGRKTYEEFAANWPHMEESEGDFAARMNSLPKFVASRTVKQLEWNATLLEGDIATEVRGLKQRSGQDLLMYSSVDFMHTLMEHDLIDEYRFWLHPVVLGSGKRLFRDRVERQDLKLVDTTTLGSGVAILAYQPAGR